MIKLKFLFLIASLCLANFSGHELIAEDNNYLDLKADDTDCGLDMIDCSMRGNVVITQGDIIIRTDKLESVSESSWLLEGSVNIENAGTQVSAETATVSLVEAQLTKVQLQGAPVSFSYEVDGESQANGEANLITFDLTERLISLDGEARLFDGGNELAGEHVEYDLNNERLKANNLSGDNNGRVHLIFEPPKKQVQPSNNTNEQPEQ